MQLIINPSFNLHTHFILYNLYCLFFMRTIVVMYNVYIYNFSARNPLILLNYLEKQNYFDISFSSNGFRVPDRSVNDLKLRYGICL